MGNTTRSTTTDRIERALSALLKPLSKLLIKNNLDVQTATEALKRALVTEGLSDESATDSQVSLRTGVHRKDVKRLRAEIESGQTKKIPTRGIALVLTTWSQEPPFCDAAGQPRLLPRKGRPDAPGFDELIKASKVDLAAATVLSELERQDLIKRHPDGQLELLSATFVAQSGDAAIDAFEATVGDHLRIATENVLSPPGAPRQFDQVLRYSHLSASSVAALEAEARKMAQSYLETLNAMAHRLQSEDDASGQLANGRFVTGAFIAPIHPTDTSTPEGVATPEKNSEEDTKT